MYGVLCAGALSEYLRRLFQSYQMFGTIYGLLLLLLVAGAGAVAAISVLSLYVPFCSEVEDIWNPLLNFYSRAAFFSFGIVPACPNERTTLTPCTPFYECDNRF